MILAIVIIAVAFAIARSMLLSRQKRTAINPFEKIYKILTSEQIQNKAMPIGLQSSLRENSSTRFQSTAYGYSPNDPIRVNGPIGELIYLSCLRNKDGIGFIGHRLGSRNGLDIFEIVSEDFASWHILYFDMYWLKKDLIAPARLNLISWSNHSNSSAIGLSVTNRFISDFPLNFWYQLLESAKIFLGFPAVRMSVKQMAQNQMHRPDHHRDEVHKIVVSERAEGLGLDS